MPVAERTLTDFLQHSGRILPELDSGEVVLRRREGDDLVIVSRKHWEAFAASMRALAEAYRDARAECQGQGGKQREWFALPWMSLLLGDDQEACIRELTLASITAMETGKFVDLVEVMAQWRATALATWDDAQSQGLTGYREDDAIPLSRP